MAVEMVSVFEGGLLTLWEEAEQDFRTKATKNGATIPDESVLNNPAIWTASVNKKSAGNKSQLVSEIVRNFKKVQQALDLLAFALQVTATAVPVAAPATFVVQAFATVFQYWSQAEEDFEKLSNFFDEVGGLFADISALNGALQPGDELASLRNRLFDVFSSCLKICTFAIEARGGKFRRWIKSKVNGDSEIDSLLNDLKRSKRNLMFSLTMHSYRAIDKAFQRSERDAVLSWLSPSISDRCHDDLLDEVRDRPRAGKWLLESEDFKEWEREDGSKLWYTGKPGAGKSILASIVIRHLQQRLISAPGKHVLIYLYMKHGKSQNIREILGMMTRQVVAEEHDIPSMIVTEWDEKSRKGKDGNEYIAKPTLEFLKTILSGLTANRSLYIVLDAMDECAFEQRQEVLNSIKEISESARILVTSRILEDEDSLSRSFRRAAIQASSADIIDYVDDEIKRTCLKDASSTLIENIKRVVTKKACGMFLLAKLHMNVLKDIEDVCEVDEALGRLPETVDEGYDQALARIKGKDPIKKKNGLLILGWLACTRRPLSVMELAHATRIHKQGRNFKPHNPASTRLLSENELVSFCCGLVEIEKHGEDEVNNVRFIHYSAEHYFSQRQEAEFPNLPYEIPLVCAKYLCIDSLQSQFDPREPAASINDFPFASYAAEYLHQHFLSIRLRRHERTDELSFYISEVVKKKVYFHLLRHLKAYYTYMSILEKHNASYRGDSSSVELLDAPSLHLAVFLGCPVLVKTLIGKGLEISKLDHFRQSPLIIAFKKNFGDIVEILLDGGAAIDLSSKKGHVLTLYAVQQGNSQAVEKILRSNCPPKVTLTSWDFFVVILSPVLLLLGVLGLGPTLAWFSQPISVCANKESATQKRSEKAQNLFNDYGQVLSLAYNGDDEALLAFLERIPAKKPERESSPSSDSNVSLVHEGHYSTDDDSVSGDASTVVAEETDFDTPNDGLSITFGNEVEELPAIDDDDKIDSAMDSDDDSDDSVSDFDGYMPSSYRRRYRSRHVGRLDRYSQSSLSDSEDDIERDEGVEAQDYFDTACFLAIERHNVEAVELLLRQGVNINSRDFNGQTLLHRATFRNSLELVKLLVKRGAVIDAEDNHKRTPFTANPSIAHRNVLKYLQDEGANIDHRHYNGVHELYRAAAFGNQAMVELFLEAGVKPGIANHFGWTPLHEASANGHLECLRLLIQYDKDGDLNFSPISDVGKTPLDLVNSRQPHYDWPCLGNDSRHYLNGVDYKEVEWDLETLERLEIITKVLKEHGAETAAEVYAKNKAAFTHVAAGPFVVSGRDRLGVTEDRSEWDGDDSA